MKKDPLVTLKMVHAFIPNIWEVEAGGWCSKGQPGSHPVNPNQKAIKNSNNKQNKIVGILIDVQKLENPK